MTLDEHRRELAAQREEARILRAQLAEVTKERDRLQRELTERDAFMASIFADAESLMGDNAA